MEKKLNEAFEEVDENKKDSAQWKNKYKKVQVSSFYQNYIIVYLYNGFKTRLKWMKQE